MSQEFTICIGILECKTDYLIALKSDEIFLEIVNYPCFLSSINAKIDETINNHRKFIKESAFYAN